MYPPEDRGKYQLLGWMPESQYEALKQSVRARKGVDIPIVHDEDGNTLDGFHGELAVEELRAEGTQVKPPTVTTLVGLDDRGKRDYVLSANLNRRQVSRKERRMIVEAELRHSPDLNNAWLAEICGTTDKTVADVREKLIARSEIPMLETLQRRDGRKQPSKITTTTPHQQKRLAKALGELEGDKLPARLTVSQAERLARRKRVQKIVDSEQPVPPENIRIIHSDFRNLEIPNRSVPLLLTDPPYDVAALPLWSDLADFAADKLTDDGVLLAYCGVATLPQCMEALARKLHYVWMMSIVMQGASAFAATVQGRNSWRPVLVYSKLPQKEFRPRRGIIDVLSNGSRQKELHPWQQSLEESEYLISKFSNPGEIVCDPFGGSFTTALAAWNRGRNFIGCDVEESSVQIGKHRLGEAARQTVQEAPQPKVLRIAPVTLPPNVVSPESPRRSQQRTADVSLPPGAA